MIDVVRRHFRSAFRSLSSKDAANSVRHYPSMIQDYVQRIVIKRSLRIRLPQSFHLENRLKVLVISCYMADRPNLIEGLVKSVEETKSTKIDFVVTNNTTVPSCPIVKPYVKYVMPRTAKYHAVRRIIKDQFKPYHDYVAIIDDDVILPPNFFDKFFKIVKALGLVLSQPALTRDSYTGIGPLACNLQIDGAIAHLTQFVETGPVTCFGKRIVLCVPYVGDSPMGWGLDFVWARICRDKRYPMGVVDSLPVQHNLREVARWYDRKSGLVLMKAYLSRNAHVPLCAAQVTGQIILRKDYPELDF